MSLPDSVVPKLRLDGSNHYHWEKAFQLYAKSQGYQRILNRTWDQPDVVKGDIQMTPTSFSSVYPDDASLHAAQLRVRDNNKAVEEQYALDWASHRRWEAATAALALVLLATVPQSLYESVSDLPDVADQFDTIVARFRDQGVTEECSIWADFFKLRAHECNTTITFVDKFKAGLAKLSQIKDCKLTDRQSVFQFILAIDTSYPDYARQRRADLRDNKLPDISKMCAELLDEARRDDPIKAAYSSTKQQSGGDSNNHNGTRGRGGQRGGGLGRGNRGGRGGSDRGNGRGGNQNSNGNSSRSNAERAHCKLCNRTHYGAGDDCWYTYPHKATPEWRERNAELLKSKKDGANAATVKDNSGDSSFAGGLCFAATTTAVRKTPVIDISDTVRELAGRGEYHDRLILDTGATDHLCNDHSKFVSFDKASYYATINTGAGPISVTQKGTIMVTVLCSDGSSQQVSFTNVLYAPQMFVSVLSHSQLREKHLYYHGYDHKLYLRQNGRDSEIAYTPEIDRIPTFLLAGDDIQTAQSLAFAAVNTKVRNSKLTPTRDVTLQELHDLFGHADVRTLRHLVNSTTGLRLVDVKQFSCEACMLSNSHQQVSRVPPNRSATFLYRVHVDIVGPVTPTGPGGEKYWVIYTDDFSRFRWIDITDDKLGITGKLFSYLDRMKTQYKVTVAVIHVDNDTVLVNQRTRAEFSRRSTVLELSTPRTAHQNGVAESSNRIIESRARTMGLAAPHLDRNMWPHAARYAVELVNHTPNAALADSKTPAQLRLEHLRVTNPVPNLNSFRTYGEIGYVHQPAQTRVQSAKFDSRAVKMYYVGREGSRIYLMWNPVDKKVHRTSSVQWARRELATIGHAQQQSPTDYTDTAELSIPIPFTPLQPLPPPSQPIVTNDVGVEGIEQGSGYDFGGLTEISSFDFDEAIDNRTVTEVDDRSLDAVANTRIRPSYTYAPVDTNAEATRGGNQANRRDEIDGDLSNRNIITTGRRQRQPRRVYAAIAISYTHITPQLARCFATAIAEAPAATKVELPPEPTSAKQARQHLYKNGWIEAEGAEYQSHDDNGTWEVVVTMPSGVWALPTKWVYKYKLTDDGKLERFKARLVVCGNRQDVDFWRETYAAVARATTLKVLLALVAALNLECDQADVITAFLNGLLDDDEIVYIRLPDGRKARLQKALYGLRRSPRLWYEELSRFLNTIGFLQLEADPCVFRHEDGSLILAYVDDIVFITQTCQRMNDVKKQVFDKYKCRDLGPISHYLGIRVRRDRQRRLIELSMESYIDKLVHDFHRENSAARHTPLDVAVLGLKMRPTDDPAPPQQLRNYQTIIGKLLYPATQLRVDISFHIGFLARSMSNPTLRHYDYALQVIDYLKTYKDLVMTYQAPSGAASLTIDMFVQSASTNLGLHGYSDASFADGEDCKSTSGYLFKLAGGTICHKSVKQKLVTTSTTEAEYVAMTFAAKEATWLHRLLHQLGYKSDDTYPIKLYGDNEPSIKLLHSDGHHERTKHVDIYYHYVKERVRDGHLKVEHVRTTAMAADGLTKPLNRVAHERFLSQIGLGKPTIVNNTTTAASPTG